MSTMSPREKQAADLRRSKIQSNITMVSALIMVLAPVFYIIIGK
jgi:glycine cleavage system pyridoxal-binding protein P